MSKRQILVTDALIYANGNIHLGHVLGYVQTDIWTRFQKMRGHDCHFICGADCHGTPIMLKAKELGVSPKEMVIETSARQLQDFSDFGVVFDNFYNSDSNENQALVNSAYGKMREKGNILEKDIEQAFDEQEQMFLPDRFIKGTCPKCKATDQYGDSCEVCGATYDSDELIDPVSVVSNTKPIYKTTTHLFFDLKKYQEPLLNWLQSANLQSPVVNKLKEWFESGLQAWDISRDSPYFGFEIPDAPGKYFYVWLDAPIGYLASFQNYADAKGLDFDAYWKPDAQTELYHFVGKDITYFHALFWPAVMMAADIRTPTGVFTHGFLTVNGEKMSKSRGTFITARQYLDVLNPEHLRYYFAAKLSDGVEDIDINFDDFQARANSDLIGKYVNIASRSAGFIKKKFDGVLADELMDPGLFEQFAKEGEQIAECYENRQYSKGMRLIMALADQVNQFIEQHKPWELAKDEAQLPLVQAVCTQALNAFYQLSVFLKPVLPVTAEKVEAFLNIEPMVWDNIHTPLLGHSINKFKPLLTRIEPEQLETLKVEA